MAHHCSNIHLLFSLLLECLRLLLSSLHILSNTLFSPNSMADSIPADWYGQTHHDLLSLQFLVFLFSPKNCMSQKHIGLSPVPYKVSLLFLVLYNFSSYCQEFLSFRFQRSLYLPYFLQMVHHCSNIHLLFSLLLECLRLLLSSLHILSNTLFSPNSMADSIPADWYGQTHHDLLF